jgi:hypothetical protein
MFGLGKKKASADDAFTIIIRALGDTLIQCKAVGTEFDGRLLGNKVIEAFEKDRFAVTENQVEQIKELRRLIKTHIDDKEVKHILIYLREVSADMWVATGDHDQATMRECARAQLFAAGYLLRFFEKHGMSFNLSDKVRRGLERSYETNIEEFLTDIK